MLTWATLRGCAITDPTRLAATLKDRFSRETSRFRAYRDWAVLDGTHTIERLLEPGADWQKPPTWSIIEPGTPVRGLRDRSIGVYGETRDNAHWGFSTAYLPDPKIWKLDLVAHRGEPSSQGGVNPQEIVEATPVPGAGATRSKFRTYWDEWGVQVRVDAWEIVNYVEVQLAGNALERGLYGIAEGLAEDCMQDLLGKTLELVPSLQPTFVDIGAGYDLRNPFKTVKQECRIPRISWANIFGPAYVAKYGREFFLDAPGYRAEELPDGSVLYQVTERFLLTDEDVERGPSPEDVEGYFRGHPDVKRIVYRPILLRNFVSIPREEKPRRVKKTTTDMVVWAEDAVAVFGMRFGVILDYSPESLRAMDDAISTHFPEGDEPLPTTILPIGAYLGEVVRINLGGRWRIEESIFDSAVELAHAELYPFRRVAKRFEEGTSASLSGWYDVVAREGPRGGGEQV